MALYAAYGSNMDPAQMLSRCPHSPQRGTGWLEGWRLTFGGEDIGWDGALATVVEDPSSRVFVVLYDLSEGDEKELDNWDGVSLGYYRRLKVRVETLDGDVLAWLYVLNFWEGGLPSARSIGILADAAERAGAPADYVSAMRALPCAKMGDSNTRYGARAPAMAGLVQATGTPVLARRLRFWRWRLWRWLRGPRRPVSSGCGLRLDRLMAWRPGCGLGWRLHVVLPSHLPRPPGGG